MEEEYGKIDKEIKVELEKFSGILDLDLKDKVSRSKLCKYTAADIERFNKLAATPIEGLTNSTLRLRGLRVCSDIIGAYLGSVRDDQIPPELKDELQEEMRQGSERARVVGNEVQGEVDKLLDAPKKINALNNFYDLACR